MRSVDEIAATYLVEWAELDPVSAAQLGLPAPPGRLTDYSPEGQEALAALCRRTLAELEAAPADTGRDRVSAGLMRDRLESQVALHEAGEDLRPLSPLFSPLQAVRSLFDLLPRSSEGEWAELAARLEAVPASLGSFRVALAEGRARRVVAARRQALGVARQARAYAGRDGSGAGDAGAMAPAGYFTRLASSYAGPSEGLAARLADAAAAASAALDELAEFLERDYAPAASEEDGVGVERYQHFVREFVGTELDLTETYQWGWEELGRLRKEMRAVARRIVPDGTLADAITLLETDPARAIEGEGALVAWLQELMDGAIGALDGRHFDIPPSIRRVEAMLAPPGGAAAMYYTPPSADLSRPGRTWYPTLGRTRFPRWAEVSTAYHEGVPGHHLQIGHTFALGDRLNAFQRLLGMVSAHIEGWALYAERLMGELGFLENPDEELGMLFGQAFRATRVVVDIGLHLGLRLPADAERGAGERWSPALAEAYLLDVSGRTPEFCASEVERYLGGPAQAIGYKVGERVWLEVRDAARRQLGAGFDLKRFHSVALDLGFVTLDQLRSEMPRRLAQPDEAAASARTERQESAP